MKKLKLLFLLLLPLAALGQQVYKLPFDTVVVTKNLKLPNYGAGLVQLDARGNVSTIAVSGLPFLPTTLTANSNVEAGTNTLILQATGTGSDVGNAQLSVARSLVSLNMHNTTNSDAASISISGTTSLSAAFGGIFSGTHINIMNASNSGFTVQTWDGHGIEYISDYSAFFQGNSLITKTFADGRYAPITGGSYAPAFSGLSSQYVKGDGTYATFPTNVSSFANDAGYLTSLSSLAWSKITGTPTTVAGYGITNAVVTNPTTNTTISAAANNFIINGTGGNVGLSYNGASSTQSSIQVFGDASNNALFYLNASNSTGAYQRITSVNNVLPGGGVTGIAVEDQINNKGLVYVHNYGANYTPLSIVHKGYVDSAITANTSSAITASSTNVLTNKDLTSVTNTFPTFNQNTTGSAAKWTTPRNLAGNSVDGSANVAFSNKFIVQGTADAGLSGAQFLGALGTGIVKNTTTTGVLSIAVPGTDYQAPLSGTGYLKQSGGSSSYVTSIPNTDLANSSITINGTPVSLGGSAVSAPTTYDYVISKSGSNYIATPRAGSGNSAYTNTNLNTVLTSVMSVLTPSGGAGTGGGSIHFTVGTFTLSTQWVISGWETNFTNPFSQLTITGEGYATHIFANTTGNNAIVINNDASVTLRDMRIESNFLSALRLDNSGANSEISTYKSTFDNLYLIGYDSSTAAFYGQNFWECLFQNIHVQNTAGDAIILENNSTTINYGNSHFNFLKAYAGTSSPYAGLKIRSTNTTKFMDMLTFDNFECFAGYYGLYTEYTSYCTFNFFDIEFVPNAISLGNASKETLGYTFNSGYIGVTTGGTGIACSTSASAGSFKNIFLDIDATAIGINDQQGFRAPNSWEVTYGYNSTPGNSVINSPSVTPYVWKGVAKANTSTTLSAPILRHGVTLTGSYTNFYSTNGNNTAASATGAFFNVDGNTYTDGFTAASTTLGYMFANVLKAPTFAASNAGQVYTNAATLAILGPPSAGTNVTITNPFSFWVQSGISRFDAPVYAKSLVVNSTVSAQNTTATLTAAQFGGGTVSVTSPAAVTLTLPTATACATQIAATQGTRYFFTIDNSASTSSGAVTLALGTGFTQSNIITGSNTNTLAIGTVGTWEIYFTSATAANISRLQ